MARCASMVTRLLDLLDACRHSTDGRPVSCCLFQLSQVVDLLLAVDVPVHLGIDFSSRNLMVVAHGLTVATSTNK